MSDYCVGCKGGRVKDCEVARINGMRLKKCVKCADTGRYILGGRLKQKCPVHPKFDLWHAAVVQP